MNNRNELKTLLDVYDAAYSEDNWTRSLDALCGLTETCGVMFYAIESSDELNYSVNAGNSHFRDKAGELLEYNRRFLSDPTMTFDAEGMAHMSRAKPFEAVLDTDIWPLEQYRKVPEVIWCRSHIKVFRRFFFNVTEIQGLQAAIIFQYANDVVSQSSEDLTTSTRIVRHMGKALEINRFYEPLRQRYKAVLSALDNIALGLCVLDEAGRPIVINSHADDLFDRRDGIWLTREGYFTCRNEDNSRELNAAIERIGRTSKGKHSEHEVQVPITRSLGHDPLLAIVSPLRDAGLELEKGLAGCMVTLIDSTRSAHARLSAFARVHRLTRAEEDVAALMLDGSSATEIAEMRNVSPGTVAGQIKVVLSKSNARNRVQFIWRVFQYAPPIV